MDSREFRQRAHQLADWMADYFETLEEMPVKSRVKPGEILARLPGECPGPGETFDDIMKDFLEIVLPGMTHWQHPSYFAYFNANNSFPSILAEMLTSAMGAQCMIWATSPAAAEMEQRMMEWLRDLLGLPGNWSGVIQDTASTATLCALLTAREVRSGYKINQAGFYGHAPLVIYCSSQAHSSVEKGVKIAGFGKENLRKVAVDDQYALCPGELEAAIAADRSRGLIPLAVVAALGTTGSTAIDPLAEIAAICRREKLWLHVDAAYAGTALILPEMRYLSRGLEEADSFVFNPHKWMFTNFDCSAYFAKSEADLVRTFEIHPEYLNTPEDERVHNYRDWGIQLGRRFRALKLWFVLRSYGAEGLRQKIREHLAWAGEFRDLVAAAGDFELLAPVPLATVCFRYHPPGSAVDLNALNARLLETLNASGKLYISHTVLKGNYTLRLVVGQTSQQRKHVLAAWELIAEAARRLAPH